MRRFIKIAFVLLVVAAIAFAQARSKRLILKDGSYQPATKWEIKGDRVRYFSAERFMWEDLPTSMVDWKATEDYAKKVEEGKAEADANARAHEEAERKAEESKTPQVAPGIHLPETGGVFLLDSSNQQPHLSELMQTGGEVNKNTGKNILRAIINPLPTGAKQTIEVKGKHASVQAHSAQPALYININYGDTADDKPAPAMRTQGSQVDRLNRFKIVRMTVKEKEDKRIVGNLKIALTGKIKEQQELVPTKSEAVSDDWVKVMPQTQLTPGEYAVVEMISPEQMNLYVWDFGVNPNAANAADWKPVPSKPSQPETEKNPELLKR